jgi:hypothetical protein
MRREAQRLHDEFRGIFSTKTIERFIGESRESLSDARVHDFVHVFL